MSSSIASTTVSTTASTDACTHPLPPPPAFVLRGHIEAVSALRFSPDGRTLFSGSTSGEVRSWDVLSTRRCTSSWSAHSRGVLHVIPLAGGGLITQGKDGFIRWWDCSRSSCTASLQTCCVSFGRCCFSPELSSVVSPMADPAKVALWDARSGAVQRTFDTGSRSGMAMCLNWVRSPACDPSAATALPLFLAGVFEDGRLYVWDLASEKPLVSESLHSEPATCLEFCGMRGASGSAAHDVPVFDLGVAPGSESGTCSVAARLRLQGRGVNDLRVRPGDCKIFATAGWDHRLRIFAWKRPRPLAVLKFHTAGVTSVDFNPSERSMMASGSQDTRIAIWSIY